MAMKRIYLLQKGRELAYKKLANFREFWVPVMRISGSCIVHVNPKFVLSISFIFFY